MKRMTQMMLLSKEDFKGFKINTDQSLIDVLAQVCCVALEKFNRLKQQQHHHQKNIVLGFPQPQPQPQPIDIEGKQEKASNLKKTIKIVRNEKKEAADDQDQDQETHYHDHGLNLRRRTGSKRSRYGDDDYNDDDDDWEVNVEPKKKKQKQKMMNNMAKKKGGSKPKSSRRLIRSSNFVRQAAPIDPDSIPDLPEIFRRRINEMQGTKITLVIQKQLTNTDLSAYHNRFSIPFTQIKDWDFLTKNEKADLRARGIMAVPLIEPEPVMRVTNMNLTQWDMAKQTGKTSSMYVLRTAWQDVVEQNRTVLVPHQVVQVWSFRVQGRLHMALVVITRPPPPAVEDSVMASTSGGGGSGSDGAGTSGTSGSSDGKGESGSGQITQVANIEAAPAA